MNSYSNRCNGVDKFKERSYAAQSWEAQSFPGPTFPIPYSLRTAL
ncbi:MULTISPECIES: hypothetical protein [unclassified Moorena]|nr:MULTISPECIES: hypothetical protein [unclassified Moorena]